MKSAITNREGRCDADEQGGFVAVIWQGQNRAYVNSVDALERVVNDVRFVVHKPVGVDADGRLLDCEVDGEPWPCSVAKDVAADPDALVAKIGPALPEDEVRVEVDRAFFAARCFKCGLMFHEDELAHHIPCCGGGA